MFLVHFLNPVPICSLFVPLALAVYESSFWGGARPSTAALELVLFDIFTILWFRSQLIFPVWQAAKIVFVNFRTHSLARCRKCHKCPLHHDCKKHRENVYKNHLIKTYQIKTTILGMIQFCAKWKFTIKRAHRVTKPKVYNESSDFWNGGLLSCKVKSKINDGFGYKNLMRYKIEFITASDSLLLRTSISLVMLDQSEFRAKSVTQNFLSALFRLCVLCLKSLSFLQEIADTTVVLVLYQITN